MADESQKKVKKPVEMGPSSPKKKITVAVLTLSERKTFEVDEDVGVGAFKEVIAPVFHADVGQLLLIFGGKVTKNDDSLQQYGIKNGFSVHLVIREVDAPPFNPCLVQEVEVFHDVAAVEHVRAELRRFRSGPQGALLEQPRVPLTSAPLSNPGLLQHIVDNTDANVTMEQIREQMRRYQRLQRGRTQEQRYQA